MDIDRIPAKILYMIERKKFIKVFDSCKKICYTKSPVRNYCFSSEENKLTKKREIKVSK